MILRPDEEGDYGQRDYNCPVDPKISRHNPIVCLARKLEKSRRKKTLGRKMLAKEYSKKRITIYIRWHLPIQMFPEDI
jgi:hypothetical protein